MRLPFSPAAAGLLLALPLAQSAAAATADSVPAGYRLGQLAYPVGGAAQTLTNGDVVTFDGVTIERHDANGNFLLTLGSFSEPIFGGVFEVDPTETFLLLGKTGLPSNFLAELGELYKVDLRGGGMGLIADIKLNFDAEFENDVDCIISAAADGFGAGTNDLYRLDTSSGLTTKLADLNGPSGPIALNAAGDLFYGAQPDSFPPMPGTFIDVLLFPASELTGAIVVDETAASVYATGFTSITGLAYDEETASLFLVENITDPNTFNQADNRIYRAASTQAASEVVVEGEFGFLISGLEFAAPNHPATFEAFQPTMGGTLRFTTSDQFSSFPSPMVVTKRREEVRPNRPVATVTGPGANGIGLMNFNVTAAPPGGVWFLLYDTQIGFQPVEQVFQFGAKPPLFTGLVSPAAGVLFLALPLDAQGEGGFSLFNNGGLDGLLVLQAMTFDAGNAFRGTSNAAIW